MVEPPNLVVLYTYRNVSLERELACSLLIRPLDNGLNSLMVDRRGLGKSRRGPIKEWAARFGMRSDRIIGADAIVPS